MTRTYDKPPILTFDGEHRWLSNFHPTQCVYEGEVYPTSEHAYQAAKFPADSRHRQIIRDMRTPGETKRHARTFTHAQSKDFHQRKDTVMLDCVRSKFLLSEGLAKKLLDTFGSELVEGNTWGDVYWGKVNGIGQNKLGETLMRVREGLFLWAMAGIYPGDITGEINKEACELLGIPYIKVEIGVMQATERVQFPDGAVVDVAPVSYGSPFRSTEKGPPRPNFEIEGHEVVETIDGKFHAVEVPR